MCVGCVMQAGHHHVCRVCVLLRILFPVPVVCVRGAVPVVCVRGAVPVCEEGGVCSV